MKQSLQLRIGQSLSMTPQLQQAIKLLQLSSLELQTEIQEALDSNPLLEVEDGDEPSNADSTNKDEKKSDDTDIDDLFNPQNWPNVEWVKASNSNPLGDPYASHAINHSNFSHDIATLEATIARILAV